MSFFHCSDLSAVGHHVKRDLIIERKLNIMLPKPALPLSSRGPLAVRRESYRLNVAGVPLQGNTVLIDALQNWTRRPSGCMRAAFELWADTF
jgi:hypothetical protein